MKKENKTLRNKCEFYKNNFLNQNSSHHQIDPSTHLQNTETGEIPNSAPFNTILMDAKLENRNSDQTGTGQGLMRVNSESKHSLYTFTVFTIITMLVLLSEGPSSANTSDFSENSYSSKTIGQSPSLVWNLTHSCFMIFKVGLTCIYLCSFLFYFRKHF